MRIEKSTKELIRKYAVKNAIDYGKADVGSVLGKVISKVANSKEIMKELREEVQNTVKEVNTMTKAELEREYKKHEGEFETEYEKKLAETSKPSMHLEGAVTGAFATRYAPAPNGYMHIGHAKAAFLGQAFAEIYKGKLFLYFDDTNPEKDRQEFVDALKMDLEWLGIKFEKEYYASDSIEVVYENARKLLRTSKAYACLCSLKAIKENRLAGIECVHRTAKQDNLKIFEDMLKGKYDEGKAIIRFKGDMNSTNTALRDPTILRIKKEEHYRQGRKYIVWPTYDLNTPIMDSIHGVTDALRSKEYELRDVLYGIVLDALKIRKPRMHTYSRLTIKNNITHKRELNRLIEEGYLKGYDDPRLVTIAALRNRGIQPLAIKNFVLRFGFSKVESTPDMSALLAENKTLIDPIAKRLFYVSDPVKLLVVNPKEQNIELKLHPNIDLGTRSYDINNTFFISKEDAMELKNNDVVRLKDLFDISIKVKGNVLTATRLNTNDAEKKIHWVPGDDHVDCTVQIPEPPIGKNGRFDPKSLKISKGYAETYASRLKQHDIVQFERFGFCILHDAKKMNFIFISR